MLFSKPELFQSKIYKKKRTMKWDDTRVEYFLYRLYHRTPKVIDEINKLNHKATVGLALACAEWVLWQFEEVENIEPYLETVHELWYGLVYASYIDQLVLEKCKAFANAADPNTAFSGCIEIIFRSLYYNQDRYLTGSHGIQYKVLSLVKLARYVAPDKKAFDQWFDHILSKSLEQFPATFSRSEYIRHPEKFGVYDTEKEAFIPRQFYFEPDFIYTTEKADEIEQTYYSNLSLSKVVNQNRANILFYSCLYGKIEPQNISAPNKKYWEKIDDIEVTGIPSVNLTILCQLPALVSLVLRDCGITDLSSISNCTKLEYLSLPSNKISDIQPLAALTNLVLLSLYSNQVTDISVLEELKQLQYVGLCKNQITDASILCHLNLQFVDITENMLSEQDLASFNRITDVKAWFENGHLIIGTVKK